MSGFSGMISFILKNEATTIPFIESLQLFTLVESLGGAENLIEVPSIMIHASTPKERREEAGIKGGLIRLSIGIEYNQSLINDLAQAFDTIKSQKVYISGLAEKSRKYLRLLHLGNDECQNQVEGRFCKFYQIILQWKISKQMNKQIRVLQMRMNVESFNPDHTKVKTSHIRVADRKTGVHGDVIVKYGVHFK